MSQERFDLLRNLGYSEKAIQYISEERNLGRLPSFSTEAAHTGQCGDMMQLFLVVDGDTIRDASYVHVGCSGLQACASALTTMIKGMSLDEAARIDVPQIVEFLGSIPPNKLDCAELARDTLRKAIEIERAKA
ncbi:MAG: iron-sulfur cluster assembly scaffold protein [Acidobacteria bacterium]|nr:iron-sulfur cluster assembly scaffold protein [Acidobacteriota bacterium]